MSKFADLHIHTHYSDSTFTPQEVIKNAKKAGLSCIAITDHDTVEGLLPTIEAGKSENIEVLAGVELSSEINGKDVHILGYLFDYTNPEILNMFNIMQNERVLRMEKMLKKLKEIGIDNIEMEEIRKLVETDALGRPHLARLLYEKGWVPNIQTAFDKFLGEGQPVYFPKFKQTPYEAIDMINKAGGVAVLAHPAVSAVDELIPSFVERGLKGLEVHYAKASSATINYYHGIAKKHNLVETGGSDAHGKAKPDIFIGMMKLPYENVELLKKAAHR